MTLGAVGTLTSGEGRTTLAGGCVADGLLRLQDASDKASRDNRRTLEREAFDICGGLGIVVSRHV
jgi:hypothetical protein